MKKTLIRYVIKADGKTVAYSFNKEKAWKMARQFEYECNYQDIPVFPKMEVVEEYMD